MLQIKIPCIKAAVNLVMALASYQEARSPVELSLSPVFHYQYSSINKSLHYVAVDAQERSALEKIVQEFCMSHYQPSAYQPFD